MILNLQCIQCFFYFGDMGIRRSSIITKWRAPKSLVEPTWGFNYVELQKVGTWGRSRLPALKGVEGRVRSLGIRLGRDQAIWSRTCIQNQHKLVKTHSACIWCWDKPRANSDSHDTPRPGLGRCHHHPPYNILCVTPSHPHPNGCLSRDSQSGVPKLSRFWTPGTLGHHSFAPTSDRDEVWTKLVALFESFSTPCRTSPAHIGSGSIPDF